MLSRIGGGDDAPPVADQPQSEMSPSADTPDATDAPPEAPAAEPPTAPAPGFDTEIAQVAEEIGVDPQLIHAVIERESGGNPNAVSEVGARGLMQLMPATFAALAPQVAALVGRTPQIDNPLDNIVAGALLYKQHLAQSRGNVEQAARLYHAGPNLRLHGPKTAAYGRAVSEPYRRRRAPA